MFKKILCFFGLHSFETIFHDDELVKDGHNEFHDECKHCNAVELEGRLITKERWNKMVVDHKVIMNSIRKAQYEKLTRNTDYGYVFDTASAMFYNQTYNQTVRKATQLKLAVDNKQVVQTKRKRKPKLRIIK